MPLTTELRLPLTALWRQYARACHDDVPDDQLGDWQHEEVHDWPGRIHVESLRLWPELVQTVERLEARSDVIEGVLLLGSLARGEGDAISDVDLVAVARDGLWEEAWEIRESLSADGLVRFDLSEGHPGIAGHFWLTPSLVRVECLITQPGCFRLAGDAVVLAGEPRLVDAFPRRRPTTRSALDAHAARLGETHALPDTARAYDELIRLLRRELRPDPQP